MSKLTKLDPQYIARCEHDEASESKRVKIVDTELSIELDADDGDSVQTQGRLIDYNLTSGEVADISICREIKVYSSGEFTVEYSPKTEGEDSWISMGQSTNETAIIPILAKRVKVTSASPIIILGRGQPRG